MTLLFLLKFLIDKVSLIAEAEFGIRELNVITEFPPKIELGDIAFPVAFELAKQIKKQKGVKANPREIANTLKKQIDLLEVVDHSEVAGAGYLNVFLNRAKYLTENLHSAPLPQLQGSNDPASIKVCVEHTSVNPNKAAHIGHVRNSVLGDTFVRILKATGKRVETQNYIDNTGVQVADVVVGFIELENMDLSAIQKLDAELKTSGRTFDYYCWDLYTRVGQAYQENEGLKAKRAEVLHLIETGNNPTAALADYVATRNVECILRTMDRISVRYDLLPRESEILHLNFWNKAFEQMKQLGVIHFENEGKNAGCWVMPFEAHEGTDEHEADKILVRSNGTVTYTGKDIAYQMWKLGILGLDFFYKPFHTYADGHVVWITTSLDTEHNENAPEFGHGVRVYNVIDTRQSYPQEVVRKGVAAIDIERGEKASVHLAYEMVALSPDAAEELGFVLSHEEKQKSFIEMSGRKGLGVKADDLLTRLEEKAFEEVESRHPEESQEKKKLIAHQIAVGALRYFLLKFTKTTVIVFDFREALSFEGETGCFCQYSAVRANSIFRKLAEKNESLPEIKKSLDDPQKLRDVFLSEDGNEIWSMLMLASRLEETVEQAASTAEPAILAKYTFNLAKAFNLFYHRHKILPEPDAVKRALLITVTDKVRDALTAALNTMGIEVPEKM